jgi:pimeloyl-ACP methyl ester carboxylesterase
MRPINLDVHISESSASVILSQDPDGTVLVGHDYGGCLITGVADRLPHAVRALVYVDAFVPDDGDSCYSMTDEEQRQWYLGGGTDADAVQPLPTFDRGLGRIRAPRCCSASSSPAPGSACRSSTTSSPPRGRQHSVHPDRRAHARRPSLDRARVANAPRPGRRRSRPLARAAQPV